MIKMESITILDEIKIEKIIDKWKINVIINLDNIAFQIENDYKLYESIFTLKNLQEFKLLSKNIHIEQMQKVLLNYFDDNKIKIEEKEKWVELIITLNKKDISNVELKIYKKNLLSEEIIEKLIIEIKNLKEENKKLDLRIKNLENERKIKEFQIDQEKINKNKKIQLTHCNPKQINSIEPHIDFINSLSTFPSGNIISVSSDKSIKIYDINLNIIQDISNAHDKDIYDLSIKDENNFITCSIDHKIKTWIKRKNKEKDEYSFNLNIIINNAHNGCIYKIIFCLNGNIISSGEDNKIKIWEENNNNKYNCIKELIHDCCIFSILLLQDKNILISSGKDKTKFFDLNDYSNIFQINQVICWNRNALKRFDEDKIIIGGDDDGIIIIISINEKKIIKEINNGFECLGICIIEEKGIFLIGGVSKEIKIYRSDNFECIKIIKDAHNNIILGINELQDNSIVSYGSDKTIKVWSI